MKKFTFIMLALFLSTLMFAQTKSVSTVQPSQASNIFQSVKQVQNDAVVSSNPFIKNSSPNLVKQLTASSMELQTPKFPSNLSKSGTDTDTLFPIALGLSIYTTEDGYLSGHNSMNWSKFATLHTADGPGTLNGIILAPGVVQNNSGSGSITVKVWADNQGMPGAELASVVVDMDELSAPDTSGSIALYDVALPTPITNIASFFLGYEISYTAPVDTFASVVTEDLSWIGFPNNLFVDTVGGWMDISTQFSISTALYIGARMDMTPTAPYAEISAATYAFGNVGTGNTAISDTITIQNSGLAGLVIDSIVGLTAPFTSTIDEDINLDANATSSFTFSFAPTTEGLFNAEVLIYTNGGTLTVNLTGTGTVPITENMPGDFETNVYDFDSDFYGWTQHDLDSAATGSIQNVTFPGQGYVGSFIAFNAETVGADMEAYGAYEGDRYAACMYALNTPNNDWLITPLTDTIEAGDVFSAYVKSATDSYGLERYAIWVSTTGTDVEDFTKISDGEYVEAPITWTQILHPLNAYVGQQIYVAIQCVSNDAFMFQVDNIEVLALDLETYTVTYDANGGTGTMEAQEFTESIAGTLTTNTFTRENYMFMGWSTTATGEVEYADGASYTATADVTLYAVWIEEPTGVEIHWLTSQEPVVDGGIGGPALMMPLMEFTPADVNFFAPQSGSIDTITAIMFHLEDISGVNSARIVIQQGATIAAGQEAYTQDCSFAAGWNTIPLTTPYAVDQTQGLYMGYELNTTGGVYPLSTADGDNAKQQWLYSEAAGGYLSLPEAGLPGVLLLKAIGTVSAPTEPTASISATSHNFETVNVGESATSVNFTLTNVGTDGLTITSVTGVAAPFTSTIDQTINLDAEGTHEFTFTYAPTEIGQQTAEVVIATNGGTFTINLSGMGYAPITENMTGDFETNVYDFDIEFFGWTQHDIDGQATGTIQDVTFLNQGYTGSYIAFNAAAAGADVEAYGAYEGERCAACMFATDAVPNNDWLITPQYNVEEGASFSAYVKSVTDSYGLERYAIWVSTTGTDVEDFTKISDGEYVEAPTEWTNIEYDLSAYAGQQIYVAIQCVSADAFMFLVDNIEIETGNVGIETNTLANFNIYPNPANSVITITNEENANIVIYNVLGKVVTTINNAEANQTINVSNLSAGVYIAKVNGVVAKFNVVK